MVFFLMITVDSRLVTVRNQEPEKNPTGIS